MARKGRGPPPPPRARLGGRPPPPTPATRGGAPPPPGLCRGRRPRGGGEGPPAAAAAVGVTTPVGTTAGPALIAPRDCAWPYAAARAPAAKVADEAAVSVG